MLQQYMTLQTAGLIAPMALVSALNSIPPHTLKSVFMDEDTTHQADDKTNLGWKVI